MNRTQTLAVALLVAVLPFTSAAFASDREEEERRHGRGDDHERHERYHERETHERHHERNDHDRYEGRRHYGHHNRHHRRHHNDYDQGYSRQGRWEDNRTTVVLPFPPLPPFPTIILNKHHDRH